MRNINDATLKHLSNKICVNLQRLSKLSINFGECRSLTDNGISDLSSAITLASTSLRDLKLNFGGYPFENYLIY